MNFTILTTDMIASPKGSDWTRFLVGHGEKQFLDFSAPNERIREYEGEARSVLDQHGKQALRNRVSRDYPKAVEKLLVNDSNPILKLIVLSRVAEGDPVCFEDRQLN